MARGMSKWLRREMADGETADEVEGPTGESAPSSLSWTGVLAGLAGLLLCQNCLKSLLSSWPVVAQLDLMLSRSSAMVRLTSSSFFLSHETLSSLRDVPRFNCRSIYWS